LPRAAAAAACFGLAGAGREIEQKRIAGWAIERGIAPVVRVVGDAEPILAAASPDDCGIALICGTGSLAFGRNAAGETARCGGWGYLLVDEGSAYAIALAGLKAAAHTADGRGPSTALLARLQAALDAPSAADLIDRVYSSEMSREKLASLATIVFECGASDVVASTILKFAAHDLANMIAVLIQRLRLAQNKYPLAIAGSVILNQEAYRAEVLGELGRREAAPSNVSLVTEPVKGAVALARRAATTA
jgi:N-acetylglucosamine kinase-like BadF-type ATPase